MTITIPPTITSTGATTWSTTDPADQLYTVTTTGTPNASLWSHLPVGASLTDNNDGTAILSGDGTTPAGSYPITIYANNGYLPVVVQNFTLTVDAPPAFTSANSATIDGDTGGTFTVTTSGTPTPEFRGPAPCRPDSRIPTTVTAPGPSAWLRPRQPPRVRACGSRLSTASGTASPNGSPSR